MRARPNTEQVLAVRWFTMGFSQALIRQSKPRTNLSAATNRQRVFALFLFGKQSSGEHFYTDYARPMSAP
jgi:hypothetical protein